jgi:hypothetical protein
VNTSKQSEHLGVKSKSELEAMYTELGVSNPKGAVESIDHYTGSGYTAMREGKYQDEVKLIDEVIDKQPKWDGEIYRGMKVKKSFIDNIKSSIGDTLELSPNSPTSFSSDMKVAHNFAHYSPGGGESVVLKMKNKRGSSIAHNSNFPGEGEVLHKSAEKYTIKSFNFDRSTNTYVVELEDSE